MAESSSCPSSVAAVASSTTFSVMHQKRGLGYGSRFQVTINNLPPGWRCERKSSKYTVWYDAQGQRYKSSSEVERALKEQGFLGGSGFSDDDTEAETGGETSEYEPTPVKKTGKEADL